MSSILRNLRNSIQFRYTEIDKKYNEWNPISPVIHKQFHTLIDQYMDLALEPLRNECDKLKKQYDESFRLYQEANEIFADCPASRSDEIRSSLYTNVKRLGQLCGRLQGRWIKSQHRYEDEYERVEKTLPKCPRCEEEFEEETERMREAYYCDMAEKYEYECSDCEDDY
jgi:hypothetical protein